ncbi:formate--tetrahydrofolate ligase [Loigolactobacillus zhaoyuanensis]|uniref:Formate--tetrahydrofolate ligase n=1 Tax=Loigolactobacillus zhaoyuanensis TaxID=2486017 RepID=A0ABW8UAP3_9LACO|nr:formate--tetrahydrofolate ligase [Loigolactobacillus zhaoyuanensis]
MSDIEIAQQNEQSEIKPIQTIAAQIGLGQHDIEQYGEYKAKVKLAALDQRTLPQEHKLILVTSINPTPAGEGKSTVTIGLGDALNRLNKQTIIALREPSLGPVMGIKGGATGGGYAQVVPMEDINLHFTGDMHALTSANNTLAALIDNHIQQGNELHIDQRRITWKRALDINDRALRNVVIGLGGPFQGVPREDGFNITVASELMAILCLATSITDLKARIARIVIGDNDQKQPVTVADLKVQGAITMLLKDALKPNLVQTLEHTPTFIHGGPFANIAHGCNSILATTAALKLADYTVTEAGFGADLGAEKFLDIKVPQLGKHPDAVVLVATIRALKYNGGVALADLKTENVAALTAGFVNLKRHIKNMQQYGLPVTVSINHFVSDTAAEVTALQNLCAELNVQAIDTKVWANGGAGGIDLANAVLASMQTTVDYRPLYDNQASITDKVTTIVQKIYGGQAVEFSTKAKRQMQTFVANGWDKLPICMAKTQYSFSDDPKQLGAPTDFTITIREFVPDLGAGFLVALTGNVLTMPGLPKKPAALNMDVAADGTITGLF